MEAFGAWQLQSLIAVGGLGEVWRATRGEQLRALKRLHTHLARNEEGRAQFAIEQRLASTLPHHPNLVHGDEAGELAGRPYVALELAPGLDLRRILTPPATPTQAAGREVRLPLARARAIVAKAAEAVAHLHAHGWVHGDVSPGNLVVAEDPAGHDDHLTLVDLGVAREIGQAGAVRGTHAYMAPEQVTAKAWTPATDVFALGVVLWELASGARLFHRGPPWLTLAAVVEAPVPPLADPALDAIAQRALAKDPARRLASAAELADQLRAFAPG